MPALCIYVNANLSINVSIFEANLWYNCNIEKNQKRGGIVSANRAQISKVCKETRAMTQDTSKLSLEQRIQMRKELIKLIRAAKPDNKARNPCYVCDKWAIISETHHLIPVSEIADFVLKHNIPYHKFPIVVVALCPNHHALWHKFETKGLRDYVGELYERYLSLEEFDNVLKLWDLRKDTAW